MPRYKPYSYAQGKFIPIHIAKHTVRDKILHSGPPPRRGSCLWLRVACFLTGNNSGRLGLAYHFKLSCALHRIRIQ
jgi:hypothetical protein